MKKILITLLLLSVAISLPTFSQVKFKDMADNHWAAEAVYDLVKRGITTGFPDGTFRGNENLSRYQTAVFLYKMAKSIEGNVGAGGLSRAEVSRMIDQAMARKGGSGSGAGSNISGELWLGYSKGTKNLIYYNQFGILRAYLTANQRLSDNAAATLTIDSTGGASGPNSFITSNTTMLRYAYVDVMDIFPQDAIPGITVNTRIGMQPTYWQKFVEDLIGLPSVASAPSAILTQSSIADTGIGAFGNINIAGMPETNYLVTALNGSGGAETNSGKHVAFRVDSRLTPNVIAALGGHVADVGSETTGTKVANALIGYQADVGTALAAVGYGAGGLTAYVFGQYNIIPRLGLLVGVAMIDLNREVSDDATTMYGLGLAYDYNERIKLVGQYRSTKLNPGALAGGFIPEMDEFLLRAQVSL